MTLALVQATVAVLLTMVATWTGLLVSVAFLVPRATARSEEFVSSEPWRCFFRGIGMAILLIIGIITASVGFPLIKLFGLGILLFVGAIIAVGCSGIAQTIGKRGEPSGTAPTFGMLIRGSLVYSLALGFPFVGWFAFAPIALVIAAGAGIAAILPERRSIYTPPTVPPGGSQYDLSGRSSAI